MYFQGFVGCDAPWLNIYSLEDLDSGIPIGCCMRKTPTGRFCIAF